MIEVEGDKDLLTEVWKCWERKARHLCGVVGRVSFRDINGAEGVFGSTREENAEKLCKRGCVSYVSEEHGPATERFGRNVPMANEHESAGVNLGPHFRDVLHIAAGEKRDMIRGALEL